MSSAAERQRTDPPDWTLQAIPEVTPVGPRIDPESADGGEGRPRP